MSIVEGNAAPAFTLTDQNADKVRLADYKGKHVIIYFYPKDDTPGCTKESCGFRDLWNDIRATGAEVVGVSPDNELSHQAFISKFNLPFSLLCDPEKKMMTEYGAWGEKVLDGKKSVGVIRSTVWVGPDGNVKKHWKRVPDAEAHPNKVLELLQAE